MNGLILAVLFLLQPLISSQVPANTKGLGDAKVTIHAVSIPSESEVALIGSGRRLLPVLMPDGIYLFPRVPSGAYRVVGRGAAPIDIVVDGKDLAVYLMPDYSGPGVRVAGRIVEPLSSVAEGVQRTVRLSPTITAPVRAGSFLVPLETALQPDGTFEFSRVPPGNYALHIYPLVPNEFRSMNVGVTNRDILEIKLQLSSRLEITGHVVGINQADLHNIVIQVMQGNSTASVNVQSDRTFKLSLAEGEYRIDVANIPAGYSVSGIAYGPLDLHRVPLTVNSATTLQDMIVILGIPHASPVKVFKVSGRVTGGAKHGPADTRVSLVPISGAGSGPTTTNVNDDGSFEFSRIRPGSYQIQVRASSGQTTPKRIEISRKDVQGIILSLPPIIDVEGTITVVNSHGGIPIAPAGIVVSFRNDQGDSGSKTTGASVLADGTFRVGLPKGAYSVSLLLLPKGYTLQEIVEGPHDLRKSRLIVSNKDVPHMIQIVLDYKAP